MVDLRARRRSMLERQVAQRPDDPFPRYGLALEHEAAGDLAAADRGLSELIERFPGYVPSYLMAARVAAALGELERAVALCERGQGPASRAGDAKAVAELAAARLEYLERASGEPAGLEGAGGAEAGDDERG